MSHDSCPDWLKQALGERFNSLARIVTTLETDRTITTAAVEH
ncbi:hypothetical protein [Paenibacillus sp. SI8]